MDSAQTVVSLDATVFSATKNNEDAQLGDTQVVPGQADVLDETENPDITYCPKGKGLNPSSTKGTIRDSSRTKTTTSQTSNSSHRSAATPSRYPSGFVTGASNPTKSSQSSKDSRKK